MERVKVVKPIPGILTPGDILISPVAGADFCLEEVSVNGGGSNERYISMDYVTVSENIPQFFQLEPDNSDFELDLDIDETVNVTKEWRSKNQILNRYEFFKNRFEESYPGSEAQIVYKNLMWFIEWLQGKAEIIG